jgi:pantothenate kinase
MQLARVTLHQKLQNAFMVYEIYTNDTNDIVRYIHNILDNNTDECTGLLFR